MASINHAFILGNVGGDPTVRAIGENLRTAQFSVATTERRKDKSGQVQESTEWHNITAFGSLADIASKYIRKGTQVAVEGRLRTRDWTDKAGVRRFTTEIVAANIQLLGGRRDGQQEAPPRQTQAGGASYSQAPHPVQNQAHAQQQFSDDGKGDLPF